MHATQFRVSLQQRWLHHDNNTFKSIPSPTTLRLRGIPKRKKNTTTWSWRGWGREWASFSIKQLSPLIHWGDAVKRGNASVIMSLFHEPHHGLELVDGVTEWEGEFFQLLVFLYALRSCGVLHLFLTSPRFVSFAFSILWYGWMVGWTGVWGTIENENEGRKYDW